MEQPTEGSGAHPQTTYAPPLTQQFFLGIDPEDVGSECEQVHGLFYSLRY